MRKLTSSNWYWIGLGPQVIGVILLAIGLFTSLLGFRETSQTLLDMVWVAIALRMLTIVPYIRAKRFERRNRPGAG